MESNHSMRLNSLPYMFSCFGRKMIIKKWSALHAVIIFQLLTLYFPMVTIWCSVIIGVPT